MKTSATATIVATALLLAPGAAIAASKPTTQASVPADNTQSASTTTRSASTTRRSASTMTRSGAASTTTRSAATTTATTVTGTTPASVPTTTITTSGPGGSSGNLLLAPPRATNLASGRAALTAYETYLQTLVGSEANGQANDAAYLNTVEFGESGDPGCKGALEPLTQGANEIRPSVQETLTLLGREIGDDLAIDYDLVAQTPLEKLASVLQRLKWVHGGHNAVIIANYLAAETTLISLPQSALCQDVLTASVMPAVVPTGTRTLLRQYDQAASAASSALGDFLALLHAYETATDQPLVQRIATLADEFARDSKADLLASGQQLTVSLETT